MSELLALAALSFVSAITPGPNNVMVWASGVQFGFSRTRPHLGGIALGVGSMVVLLGTGLGVLVTAVPGVEVGLKIIGSGYLIYLAVQIAWGRSATREDMAKPLTLWQALAFQWVNPKAWVFVLAAVTTFRPPEMSIAVGTLLMAVVMMAVIIPCASLWAAAGTFLSRYLTDQRRSLLFRVTLGVLLMATVVYIWL